MEMMESHAMELQSVRPSGEEEWSCPVCGRRFLMDWRTAPERVVLDPGDEYALHTCARGGLAFGAVQLEDEETIQLTERLRRSPWAKWVDQLDFDPPPDDASN